MKAASGTFGSARDGCRIVPSKRVRAPAIADIAPRLWLAVSDPHLLRAITDGRIAHTSTQRPNPFAAKGFSFYPREASSRVLDHAIGARLHWRAKAPATSRSRDQTGQLATHWPSQMRFGHLNWDASTNRAAGG